MTVKAKVGRTRYVAFRVDGAPLSRASVAGALPPGARLTRFDGTWGIARVAHTDRDALLSHLRAVTRIGAHSVTIVPLATSGTIRAAAARLPPNAPASKRGPKPRPGDQA